MIDPALRRALFGRADARPHAASCDAAGMPRCAAIALRLAEGRPHATPPRWGGDPLAVVFEDEPRCTRTGRARWERRTWPVPDRRRAPRRP